MCGTVLVCKLVRDDEVGWRLLLKSTVRFQGELGAIGKRFCSSADD
jgi:hypothetical protein